LEAKVQSICGNDNLDSAIYSVTTDIEGELGGEGAYDDGTYNFRSETVMTVAEHTLTLRVVAETGTASEDTVTFEVVENTPPAVTLSSPDGDSADWSVNDGAPIIALVDDAFEDLDTLALSWTVDGMPHASGPTRADATGTAAWTLTGLAEGCHEIAVTVTDAMDQTASDSAEFVLWVEESEVEAYRWWVDIDEDGWGTSVDQTLSCEQPVGGVGPSVVEDCDDNDASVHPGAADYCNDGIDTDCDPITPTGCYPWGEVSASRSDANISGAFYDVAAVGDVDGDGVHDIALGGTDQYFYVISGPVAGDMSVNHSLISEQTGGVASFQGALGYSIAGGLDMNGDGLSDLALGNPWWAYACSGNYTVESGKAYLLFGGAGFPSGTIDSLVVNGLYADPGKTLMFHTSYLSGCDYALSLVGSAVHLLPDMDGDGFADLAIAATSNDETSNGSVWIFLSSQMDDLVSGTFVASNYRLELVGPDSTSRLGTALGSADVDGDGLSDLLVSSVSTDPADPGTVYVVFGRDLPAAQSTMDIRSIASITLTGVSSGAAAGSALAGVGDLDGDGDEEYLVVAPGENGGAGVVYLVPGFYEVNGSYRLDEEFSSSTSPNATGAVVFTGTDGDALSAAKPAGDLNNDGDPDLVIGAPGHDGMGAAYVLYGGPNHWGDWWDKTTGAPRETVDLYESAVAKEHTAIISSEQEGEGFGTDVEGATDLNGDGIDDIIVGSSPNGGMTRVFFGGGS
jgi:hypothetical protein